jgi:hypothetical protein
MRDRIIFGAAGVVVLLATTRAGAIPSPVNHEHNASMVHWKEPGSPALPWDNPTANSWNHNHLTADPFSNGASWQINKAWDNRTLHNSVGGGPAQFGHGLIEAATSVRFGWGGAISDAAKDAVELGYTTWTNLATQQFNLHKDVTDILAMNFARANAGAVELTFNFVPALVDAYAEFNGTNAVDFVAAPTIGVQTNAATKRIRPVGSATNTSFISVSTPWSFDGTPDALADIDLEYSDDSGGTWNTLAPAGFGDLTLSAATANTTTPAADTLFRFEMDFRTIAWHEIGHTIALGHTGTGIMRTDIADRASYGNTLGIEAAAALAAAITYTYSVPEPATLALAGLGGILLMRRRSKVM